MIMAATASSMVAGKARPITSVTGSPVRIELPKSPVRTRCMNLPYCTQIGWS